MARFYFFEFSSVEIRQFVTNAPRQCREVGEPVSRLKFKPKFVVSIIGIHRQKSASNPNEETALPVLFYPCKRIAKVIQAVDESSNLKMKCGG